MANVRLLRQRLTDYNTAIDRINSRYQRNYDAYAADVEAWNAIAKATPYVVDVGGGGKTLARATLSNGERVPLKRLADMAAAKPGFYYNGGLSFSEYPTAAGPLPVEPTMGKAPRQPNLTENDIRAIQNPPTNAAGVEMARAKGWTGESELVAENEDRARISAFESAFDNPDNPQALKDRGILAKTLAGRL